MSLFSPKTCSRSKAKAERALSGISGDGALAEVVLDVRARSDIRKKALDMISDDETLADIVSVLADGGADGRSGYDPYRRCLVEKAFCRAASKSALSVMIKDLCRMPLYELKSLIKNDEVKEKIVKNAADAARAADDPVGFSNLMISLMPERLPELIPALASKELLLFHADHAEWIARVRAYMPKEAVLAAFDDDPRYERALFDYQIADGEIYRSECDFGVHDYVFVPELTERVENPEENDHPAFCSHFRCSRCGRERIQYDDGYGRIRWLDEKS